MIEALALALGIAGLLISLYTVLLSAHARHRRGAIMAIVMALILTTVLTWVISAKSRRAGLETGIKTAAQTYMQVVKDDFDRRLARVRYDIEGDFLWDGKSINYIADDVEDDIDMFWEQLARGEQVFGILGLEELRESNQEMLSLLLSLRETVVAPMRGVGSLTQEQRDALRKKLQETLTDAIRKLEAKTPVKGQR
jgi:hypothetical protein